MSASALFLVADRKHSGLGRVALLHARLLRETGTRAIFRSQPGGSLETAARALALWHDCGLRLPGKGQVWSLLSDWLRLRAVVEHEKVRMIFCYRSVDHLLGAAACGGRVPIVRYLHGLRGRRMPLPRPHRLLARRTTHVLAADPQTQATARALVLDAPPPAPARAPGPFALDDELTTITPGGVDTRHFTPDRGGSEVRLQLGLADTQVVVGLVSRIKPGRGHALFLRAFALAATEEPCLRALMVGGGDEQEVENLRGLARDLGVGDKVALYAPGSRYESALAAIDIGCQFHPGSAGTGQAALELMSMARPVVVLRVGALASLLQGAVSVPLTAGATPAQGGYTAEVPRLLANHFLRLARDPDLRLARGAVARRFVEEYCSRRVLQQKLTRVWERSA